MNVQPTVEYHQEFHLAPNTDTCGCCGFFKSKTKEFGVNANNELVPRKKLHPQERKIANQRLAHILKLKLSAEDVDKEIAFERLRQKIDDDFVDEAITSERLAKIIRAIHEVKCEQSRSRDCEDCSEAPQESDSSKNLSEQ